MAISVVQTKPGTATSALSLTITLTSATTAGNCLVVCTSTDSGVVTGVTLGGVADNFASAIDSQVHLDTSIWVDPNCAGGQTSVKIQGNASGDIAAVVFEVSGLKTSAVVDKTHTGSGTSSTPWSSGTTATTTQANEIWIGCLGDAISGGTATGPSSPWTNTTASSGNIVVAGYQIVSSTGTATYSGTATGTTAFGWDCVVATLLGSASNVSVALPVAQVNAAAPAPSTGAGPLSLGVAQESVAALPVAPVVNVNVALPVAQVNVSAFPPAPQMSGVSLPVAQVNVAAPAVTPSVNVNVALPVAQVNVSAHGPSLSRQLLISLASKSGTDDYGTAFPQGILATAGVIEGPEIIGSDAFFYSSKTLGGLTQSITAADGTDAYGNAYIAGTATYANNGTFWSAIVVASGVVNWYKATTAAGPWTSEAGIGFSWNNLTGGGLNFTGPAGNGMTGDLNVTGNVTVSATLTVNGTNIGSKINNIISALSGASTTTNGLTDGTINGTSGAASAGTAHTHGAGSYAVTNGQHHHVLPTVP